MISLDIFNYICTWVKWERWKSWLFNNSFISKIVWLMKYFVREYASSDTNYIRFKFIIGFDDEIRKDFQNLRLSIYDESHPFWWYQYSFNFFQLRFYDIIFWLISIASRSFLIVSKCYYYFFFLFWSTRSWFVKWNWEVVDSNRIYEW